MREVIYKNLVSPNERKKNILLQEVFEKDGVRAKTERRCFYFIKDVKCLENESELNEWRTLQTNGQCVNKRNFHIFRQHNDCLGEDKFICKIIGTFYVIVGRSVYTIAFLHSFKVTFGRALA